MMIPWLKKSTPPDLDDIFRDLQQKVSGMFSKNSSPLSPPNRQLHIPFIPLLLILILIWFSTGFYIVDQGSLGVVQRFGRWIETTQSGPRWHLPYPFESATVVNMAEVRRLEVGYRSAGEGSGSKIRRPQEALMLTEDENIIDLQFAVQYNLKNATDYLFNNRSTDDAVQSAAESAIREVVGKNKLDDLLQKGLADTSERLQSILDNYKTGVNIISVSLQGAQPPEQVQEAFEDVNRANQDNQRQINEGQAYANDVIPKARGSAARLLSEANAYKLRVENEAKGNTNRFENILTQYQNAPDITRQRLFLDAMEQMLSQVSKVFVEQSKGNSLLYLPLDKLMAHTESTAAYSGNAILAKPNESANASNQTPRGSTPENETKAPLNFRDALRERERETR